MTMSARAHTVLLLQYSIPDTTFTSFSVFAWVNPDSKAVKSDMIVASQDANLDNNWEFWLGDGGRGNIVFVPRKPTKANYSSELDVILVDERWYYVGMSFDQGTGDEDYEELICHVTKPLLNSKQCPVNSKSLAMSKNDNP